MEHPSSQPPAHASPNTSAMASHAAGPVCTGSGREALPTSSKGLLGWTLVLSLCLLAEALGWLGGPEPSTAVASLQGAKRVAFFQHTLATVENACPGASGPVMDHCRLAAGLLLAFPECNQACSTAAMRILTTSRATR